jgi:hypothetical protein
MQVMLEKHRYWKLLPFCKALAIPDRLSTDQKDYRLNNLILKPIKTGTAVIFFVTIYFRINFCSKKQKKDQGIKVNLFHWT